MMAHPNPITGKRSGLDTDIKKSTAVLVFSVKLDNFAVR